MALLAIQICMTSRQREFGFTMVERYIFPIRGLMAGGAICSELAAMFIVLFMTGITICGSALVNVVDVALFAFDLLMFAFEFEICKVVIELGWFPGIGGMAGGAVRAETTLVRFVFAMAGVTILRQGLQVCNGARIQMTLCAGRICVFAC